MAASFVVRMRIVCERPEHRADDAEQVSQQRPAAAGKAVAEGHCHSAERHQHPQPLQRPEPFLRDEEVQPERRDAGREVDEDHHAGRVGQPEPGENEEELPAEQHPGEDSGPEGPVALTAFVPQGHFLVHAPAQQQRGGDHRAQAGLEHQGDAGRGELGGDVADPPDQAQQHHRRNCGRVERLTVGHGLIIDRKQNHTFFGGPHAPLFILPFHSAW